MTQRNYEDREQGEPTGPAVTPDEGLGLGLGLGEKIVIGVLVASLITLVLLGIF